MARELIRIRLGGLDYTRFITELNPIVKENKKQVKNIKGTTMTLRSRARVVVATLDVVFPYLSIQKTLELQALFSRGNTVDVVHNLDAPQGLMECVEFKTSLVKTLDGILNNVVITLAPTSVGASGVIQPVNPHHLTAAQVPRLLGA